MHLLGRTRKFRTISAQAPLCADSNFFEVEYEIIPCELKAIICMSPCRNTTASMLTLSTEVCCPDKIVAETFAPSDLV